MAICDHYETDSLILDSESHESFSLSRPRFWVYLQALAPESKLSKSSLLQKTVVNDRSSVAEYHLILCTTQFPVDQDFDDWEEKTEEPH